MPAPFTGTKVRPSFDWTSPGPPEVTFAATMPRSYQVPGVRVHGKLLCFVQWRANPLLSTMTAHTSPAVASAFMFVLGLGLGSVMQVLVLAVQNAVPYADLGVATSGATLFRSMGGVIGTAVLGNSISDNLNWRCFINVTHLVTTIPEDKPSEEALFGAYWAKYGK